MSRIFFYVLMIAAGFTLSFNNVSAQKTKAFPKFDLLRTDSSHFKSSSVKNGEPAMLIYFSPTCDHCRQFISDLLKNMQSFKQYQIILVTYIDLPEIKKFENDYQLKKYKNIITGTEGADFTVRYFYNVGTFPFTALYNKNKTLVAVYRQPPSLDKLKGL